MTTSSTPSIFESFNARNLAPSQVAKTFVPQTQFHTLAKRCHSLLIGPRGSGKTTLLKMLQPQALEAWDHPKADEFRNRIDFSGIFVASDVSWTCQREALGERLLDPSTQQLLSQSLFVSHVLRALATTLIHRAQPVLAETRTFKRVHLQRSAEDHIARSIGALWHLESFVPSLQGLKHALLARISHIREFARMEEVVGPTDRPKRLLAEKFLYLDLLDSVSSAIQIANDVFDEPEGRWALLFDELEVAPPWVVEQLMQSLRSTDERLIFKLAMSPVSSIEYPTALRSASGPSAGQDFEQIPLWYVEKNDSYSFCEALWNLMLREKGIPQSPPQEVLGRSYSEWSEGAKGLGTSVYHPSGRVGTRFVRLAEKDHSFSKYLEIKKIKPAALHTSVGPKADQVIRKVAPIVIFRDFFRGKDQARRSRKVASIYAGTESMFAVTEGNPRIFIGMMEPLLDQLAREPSKTTIPVGAQARAIQKTADRFVAMLKTVPTPPTKIRGRLLTVNGILTRIGKYFEHEIILAPFNADPASTVRVDLTTDNATRIALDKALNAGALVHVPDNEAELFLRSVVGRRFRLSYLLAPLFHLPLRLDKEVALSSILKSPPAAGDSQSALEY